MLPHLKQEADLSAIYNWVDTNIDKVDAFVLSAEMYLYGGLIASRTSNDSTTEILTRLKK